MAIVQPKSVKYRVWATHLVMWGFLALIIFPLIMVIAISFRNGNFAVGEIIPSNPTLDHWKLALGMSITNADGSITPPPFPVLTWLWNSIKIAGITALMIVTLSTTCAYAFARLRFRGKSTILQGMLIFQMFPAVLALVAIYALFNKIGDYIPWLGLNTHGGLILAYMGGHCPPRLDHQGLLRDHRLLPGGGGGHRRCDPVAGIPSDPVAPVGAHPGGSVYSGLYRFHYRGAHGLHPAAGCEQSDPGGRGPAVPLSAELSVG